MTCHKAIASLLQAISAYSAFTSPCYIPSTPLRCRCDPKDAGTKRKLSRQAHTSSEDTNSTAPYFYVKHTPQNFSEHSSRAIFLPFLFKTIFVGRGACLRSFSYVKCMELFLRNYSNF